jgi:SpoVK/Ycf46/Vps4 family AAA+-type ATPase
MQNAMGFSCSFLEAYGSCSEHAPSIIFMDEIDSIGGTRMEGGSGGGDSEVQRTMLELLNQLDGFEATKNIKVGCCGCVFGECVSDHKLGDYGNQPYRHSGSRASAPRSHRPQDRVPASQRDGAVFTHHW